MIFQRAERVLLWPPPALRPSLDITFCTKRVIVCCGVVEALSEAAEEALTDEALEFGLTDALEDALRDALGDELGDELPPVGVVMPAPIC